MSRRKLILLLAALFAGQSAAWAAGPEASPEPLTVLLEPVPPYSYQDPEGRPVGYAVELMQEMLRRARLKGQIEFNSWANIYQRALAQPRVLVVSMARLEEREPHFMWIGPTAARRAYLYRLKSRPDVQAHSLEAAKAYKIAVIRDDAAERDLLARGFELGKQLDRSPDHAAMLRKLFAQRTELAALNSTVAPAAFAQFGYDFAQVEPQARISDTKLYMALSRGSGAALHRQLQQAWEAMKKDGTVAATAARYPFVSFE